MSALVARCALVVVAAVCALSALAALGTFASVASLICLPVREFDLILSPVTLPLVRRLPGIEPFLMDDPLMSFPILVAAPCASDVPLTANASATRATPIAGETRIRFENTLPPSSTPLWGLLGRIGAPPRSRLTSERGERL